MWHVIDAVYTAVDNQDCNWREEYEAALALLDSALDRAPAGAREFLLEKLTHEDLPKIARYRGVPFRNQFSSPIGIGATVN
jgi:hypothetical protein